MTEPESTNRQERILSLVRSYRNAVGAENPHARSLIRDELSRELGLKSRSNDADVQTTLKADTPDYGHPHEESDSEPPTASQIDLKIRKMIHAGADWVQFEPLVWQMVRSHPSSETAVKAFELATLNGGINQIDRIAALLLGMGLNHYEDVHDGVRSAIVVKLWEMRKPELIRELLTGLVDESKFNDIEILFQFFELLNSDEILDALALFHQHFDRIEASIHRFGRIISLTRDQLYLRLTRSAIQICQDGMARRFAQQIEPGSREYTEALEMLGSISDSLRIDHLGELDQEIRRSSDWRDRIRIIQDRAEDFIRNPRVSLATELIGVFSDPLRYLPQGGEPWRMMARYCASRFELTWQIPSFLNIFCDNIVQFHTRAAELALWDQNFVYFGTNPSLKELSQYLTGVAAIHRYVSNGPRSEALLWQAHGFISRSGATVLINDRPNWNDICAAAIQHLRNSRERSGTERDLMLTQLQLASDIAQLESADILRYIESDLPVDNSAIHEIQIIARSRKDHELELRLLQRKAQQFCVTNQDLDRIFQIAIMRNQNDLAWRSATILKNRRALDRSVQGVWEFSGEARQSYPMVAPDLALLRKCFADLPSSVRKLANDFVMVSGILPELLLHMEKKSVISQRLVPSSNGAEENLERRLMQIEWLPVRSRIIAAPDLVVLDNLLVIPPFVEIVERTDWNYVFLRVCEKMGLCAFGWDASRIKSILSKLVDANGEIRIAPDFGSKFEKMIGQLRIEESIALRGFAANALKMSADELIQSLTMIVCRIALIVYPSHDQALKSVMMMRGPIALVRNIEAMMISDAYSTIRQTVGLSSIIPASASIRNRPSILTYN